MWLPREVTKVWSFFLVNLEGISIFVPVFLVVCQGQSRLWTTFKCFLGFFGWSPYSTSIKDVYIYIYTMTSLHTFGSVQWDMQTHVACMLLLERLKSTPLFQISPVPATLSLDTSKSRRINIGGPKIVANLMIFHVRINHSRASRQNNMQTFFVSIAYVFFLKHLKSEKLLSFQYSISFLMIPLCTICVYIFYIWWYQIVDQIVLPAAVVITKPPSLATGIKFCQPWKDNTICI